MKNKLGYKIIFGLVLLFTMSCNHDIEKDEQKIIYDTDFNSIQVDSLNYSERNIDIYFTDSSVYFNHIITGQVGQYLVHKYRLVENKNSEKISFIFSTPLRDEKIAFISLSLTDFQIAQAKFTNPNFSNFISELFELNKKYQKLFDPEKSSLLDRINSFFAFALHEKYKDEMEDSQYFFGYDSYEIFIQYFKDCKNFTKTEATEFVDMLSNDTLFIKPDIRPELTKLIYEHCR